MTLYTLELGYPGSSKKKAVSTNMPDVLIKLKTLKEDKFNFVEPNNISSYGLPFTVLEDGLRLYAGPDESYAPLAILYKGEQLHELGYNTAGSKPSKMITELPLSVTKYMPISPSSISILSRKPMSMWNWI